MLINAQHFVTFKIDCQLFCIYLENRLSIIDEELAQARPF